MPSVDALAVEYQDRVAFVAPAWKASLSATSSRADQLLRSGVVMWGLDAPQRIFSAYGVGYQPVTIMIGADKTIVKQLFGAQGSSTLRAAIEELLSISG
ncbi:MAG: hypothetical protein OXI56_07475 [bacterium]|nr:hypothetical protein [bacterium]MDE0601616.1 hypothetical protein [bacterium]